MRLRCPSCGSKDLWQPRKKTSFDALLEKHGYDRYDCRNCWKRSIFRVDRRKPRPETLPPYAEPAVQEFRASEPIEIPRAPESTIIGASVLISGEIFSTEGITIRGVLEGTLAMDSCRLVIEPGGNVAADVTAGSIVVCREGTLTGQVRTASFVVEDGASFNGKIELTH